MQYRVPGLPGVLRPQVGHPSGSPGFGQLAGETTTGGFGAGGAGFPDGVDRFEGQAGAIGERAAAGVERFGAGGVVFAAWERAVFAIGDALQAESDELAARFRDFCVNMPPPAPDRMFSQVYAEGSPNLDAQRAEYLAYHESFEEAR